MTKNNGLQVSRRRWIDKNIGLERSWRRWIDKNTSLDVSRRLQIDKNDSLEDSRRRWMNKNNGLEGLVSGGCRPTRSVAGGENFPTPTFSIDFYLLMRFGSFQEVPDRQEW